MLIHHLQVTPTIAVDEIRIAADIQSIAAQIAWARTEIERVLKVPSDLLRSPSEGISGA